jgi:hypothetical protein
VRRIPELLIGILIAVAIFAIGLTFGSSYFPITPAERAKPISWQWMTHNAAGFFTAWLVIVGIAQLALFRWQLQLMRKSLEDAKVAAQAAQQAAITAGNQLQLSSVALRAVERAFVFCERIRSSWWLRRRRRKS